MINKWSAIIIIVLHFREYMYNRIFSEIDEPFNFNETLINGNVLNVVSMDNIRFFFFFCGNHYSKSYQHLE